VQHCTALQQEIGEMFRQASEEEGRFLKSLLQVFRFGLEPSHYFFRQSDHVHVPE
jgi:hypothetical protein